MARESNGLLSGGVKTFATLASAGAATVSILSFLHSWGIIGTPDVRATVGAVGAKWIGVRPLVDTARALRDTLHLAATITDRNGAILYGAKPTWTTENPAVATVEQDGTVIARAAGETTIIALIGELSARSRIVVRQAAHRVVVAGDSAVGLSEGQQRELKYEAFDRRGYVIARTQARWRVQSGAGVSVDSTGIVRASEAGNAIVAVHVEGAVSQALVRVRPSPAAMTAVTGDAQRGPAGEPLKQPVVVRVVNHRGAPVEGTLVRFHAPPGMGAVDPAVVVTDMDGRVRTTWTLGDMPGRQRVLASVERVDSALALHALAQPVAANTRIAILRDSIGGIVGRSADTLAVVRLSDSTGRALRDVPLQWTPLDGGSVSAAETRTDSLGEARVPWMLGKIPGAQRMRVRVGGDVPPVTLTAIARPDPAVVALQARARERADSVRRSRKATPTTKAASTGAPRKPAARARSTRGR